MSSPRTAATSIYTCSRPSWPDQAAGRVVLCVQLELSGSTTNRSAKDEAAQRNAKAARRRASPRSLRKSSRAASTLAGTAHLIDREISIIIWTKSRSLRLRQTSSTGPRGQRHSHHVSRSTLPHLLASPERLTRTAGPYLDTVYEAASFISATSAKARLHIASQTWWAIASCLRVWSRTTRQSPHHKLSPWRCRAKST